MSGDRPEGSAPSAAHPQQTDHTREGLRQFADLLATVLDRAFPIPGTRFRIGLDPLLGLIPGIGDTIANLIGSAILFLGTKLQLPRIVLVRMSVNMFLNGTVGAVPLLGDLFSVWFQSNARNATLLRKHSRTDTPHTTLADWLFVVGLGLATILAIVAVIAAVLWLGFWLWRLATTN